MSGCPWASGVIRQDLLVLDASACRPSGTARVGLSGGQGSRDSRRRETARDIRAARRMAHYLSTHNREQLASSGSDRNRDGNTGNRQRPEAVINSRFTLARCGADLGIRYT